MHPEVRRDLARLGQLDPGHRRRGFVANVVVHRIHSEEDFWLRYRRPGLGDGGDNLRWRKWLGQKDAGRNALSGPFISIGIR
jgi:hypothetical protein